MMTETPAPPRRVDRDELVRYLDRFLEASVGLDYCPNGLQVEGRPEISKIVTGVSACLELFSRAHETGSDAVIVHHGLFWHGGPQVLTGIQYRRVAELIGTGINLLAYHLPLDRHPEVGNNALAARALGLTELESLGEYKGLPVGFSGILDEALELSELESRIHSVFDQSPLVFPFGPDRVQSIGIVSGAAGDCLHDAVARGLDLFLTGEADEWIMNVAKEASIHFVAAGHYATERIGIRALGTHLQQRFGIDVEFVDIPNPV